MKRTLVIALLILGVSSCRLHERKTLELLPEDIKSIAYDELLERAKTQVNLATEAFYTDDWLELQDAALALEQTSRFFVKATDVPAKFKDQLPQAAADLGDAALRLHKEAHAKNVTEVNARLQTIHLKIREFHSPSDS